MNNHTRIYFVSDSHLGVPDRKSSLEREKLLVQWLEEVGKQATAIYLLGDIFDFWFEYRTVIPKGFVRLQGKLAELADKGIDIHFFTGNHDMWAFGYFQQEIGLTIHRKPLVTQWGGKVFYIGHGDGLGPGDQGYKWLKKVFSSPVCQRLFGFIHPGIGVSLATYFSRRSRAANADMDEVFLGEEKEWLFQFCREVLTSEKVDYFVFGHRHLPLDMEIQPGVRYVNTGDWVKHFSYAVFDGNTLSLQNYRQ